MEKRIIQLETLVAYQEKALAALNQELFRQQQDTARLQRHLLALEKKLTELGQDEQIGGNERPPHY